MMSSLAFLGWPEIMGILIVVLILFGAKKVPELMRGLGSGIKEFKKASRDVQDEFQRAIDEEPPVEPRRVPPAPRPADTATTASGGSPEARV
jgi:sec-independent protein translocase protein TatA